MILYVEYFKDWIPKKINKPVRANRLIQQSCWIENEQIKTGCISIY